jgi:hypothetical protein
MTNLLLAFRVYITVLLFAAWCFVEFRQTSPTGRRGDWLAHTYHGIGVTLAVILLIALVWLI